MNRRQRHRQLMLGLREANLKPRQRRLQTILLRRRKPRFRHPWGLVIKNSRWHNREKKRPRLTLRQFADVVEATVRDYLASQPSTPLLATSQALSVNPPNAKTPAAPG